MISDWAQVYKLKFHQNGKDCLNGSSAFYDALLNCLDVLWGYERASVFFSPPADSGLVTQSTWWTANEFSLALHWFNGNNSITWRVAALMDSTLCGFSRAFCFSCTGFGLASKLTPLGPGTDLKRYFLGSETVNTGRRVWRSRHVKPDGCRRFFTALRGEILGIMQSLSLMCIWFLFMPAGIWGGNLRLFIFSFSMFLSNK